jgi:hypothetical protein
MIYFSARFGGSAAACCEGTLNIWSNSRWSLRISSRIRFAVLLFGLAVFMRQFFRPSALLPLLQELACDKCNSRILSENSATLSIT